MRGLFIIGTLTPVICILLMAQSKATHKEVLQKKYVVPVQQPSIAPPKVQPKPTKPRPGSRVEWFDFQPVKNLSDPTWGNVLTDIENHLPQEMGTQYRFEDKNTWAHETTHGVHSYLNNTYSEGRHYYCLYTGNNKAVKIKQPKVTIGDVAEMVPNSMQKGRFNLYLVQQRKDWDKEPLYLWDEWIAYCNGAACGLELINKGTYRPGKNDAGWSVLEFGVYATYVAIAQKKIDPTYDNKQLLESLAWNLERSMSLYNAGQKTQDYNWDDGKYLQLLQTDRSAAEFRNFLINTYGAEWTNQVFGFKQ